MIDRKSLENILRELLPDNRIEQFSLDWILNSPMATEESVKDAYKVLKNYELTDDRIATCAYLLGMNPETIERNYQKLLSLGIKDKKIASRAGLLGMNPETIKRNYQHHVSLLRQDYIDRASGRDLLTNQASLLGISPETTNANVQFLYELGIDYYDAFLLISTPQRKRKKMAWMLRELFDYRNLQQEQKRNAINKLYDFIRDYPRVLKKSISSMENTKEKLRERVVPYIQDNF